MGRRVGEPHRWTVLLAVAVGGALGSLARYGLGLALPHERGQFGTATLLANIGGCLLIGVLMMLIITIRDPHPLLRPFAGIGVLGGFTTFSTFVVEAMDSALTGRPGLALLYAAVSVLASLLAVALGMRATRVAVTHVRRGATP
ncbi:camphor resistance protein CrcB [Amycolatopsis marina]|uniref:Fluoride-specific ion channel FluC n=1 Tax=Amycolatopsis marina TaxID=490629 RepID=A0A1I1AQZ2_9PSEU|nr:CrcB family protein [Amycolatopsis marina]SFB39912.1 camphor resistance protein CrcB [Amycolatopsis marina]